MSRHRTKSWSSIDRFLIRRGSATDTRGSPGGTSSSPAGRLHEQFVPQSFDELGWLDVEIPALKGEAVLQALTPQADDTIATVIVTIAAAAPTLDERPALPRAHSAGTFASPSMSPSSVTRSHTAPSAPALSSSSPAATPSPGQPGSHALSNSSVPIASSADDESSNKNDLVWNRETGRLPLMPSEPLVVLSNRTIYAERFHHKLIAVWACHGIEPLSTGPIVIGRRSGDDCAILFSKLVRMPGKPYLRFALF